MRGGIPLNPAGDWYEANWYAAELANEQRNKDAPRSTDMKPKTKTLTEIVDDSVGRAPTSKTMGRTDQITAAKIEALYRAVIELKGGSDPNLEKAFRDAGGEGE